MDDDLAKQVRDADPDRFLTALFAPVAKRDALLALYAFNHELARAREVVSEPGMALIRLQWWREVVEGAHRHHPVAERLAAALDSGMLARGDLAAIIDAREVETEPFIATVEEWESYLLRGAGGVAVAAARLLGASEPEPFRFFGAAYGVAGLVRSVRYLASQHRCLLPKDLLEQAGASPEEAIANPDQEKVRAALAQAVGTGRGFLAQAPRRVQRHTIAAALPAVLARRDLARWPRLVPSPRSLGDRLAVILAGLRGSL